MSLKKLVHDNKPREKSGPRSSNRFDFQKEWAICKLLELHQTDDDYLLVLDYPRVFLFLSPDSFVSTSPKNIAIDGVLTESISYVSWF